jgi:tripartite-type tricarboxylate transporter receptor subunit TctC
MSGPINGNVNFTSAGIGTPQHVAGELFKTVTGVSMLHVPHSGAAPALSDDRRTGGWTIISG